MPATPRVSWARAPEPAARRRWRTQAKRTGAKCIRAHRVGQWVQRHPDNVLINPRLRFGGADRRSHQPAPLTALP